MVVVAVAVVVVVAVGVGVAIEMIAAYQQRAATLMTARNTAIAAVRAERAALDAAVAATGHVGAAQAIIQALAKSTQEVAHARIAGIVTRCLAGIFDQPYGFAIRFDRAAGKTAARLVFTRSGHEYTADDVGGGVVDVASFALRLAALLLMKPAPRRLLVADEPFKHVSRNYLPRIREMIETLAREMSVQFIIVTHSELLRAGRVIEVTPEVE